MQGERVQSLVRGLRSHVARSKDFFNIFSLNTKKKKMNNTISISQALVLNTLEFTQFYQAALQITWDHQDNLRSHKITELTKHVTSITDPHPPCPHYLATYKQSLVLRL